MGIVLGCDGANLWVVRIILGVVGKDLARVGIDLWVGRIILGLAGKNLGLAGIYLGRDGNHLGLVRIYLWVAEFGFWAEESCSQFKETSS